MGRIEKSRKIRVLALLAGLLPPLWQGGNDAMAAELSREYVSAPLMGSGGAGLTDVSGLEALFYNPANLARSQSVIGDIILVSPQIEASTNGLGIYKDVQANKNMLDIISSVIGHPVKLGVQNASGASFRRTALGLLQRVDLQISLKNDSVSGLPVASVSSSVRAGAAYGIARSFASNTFHLGVTGLLIQKAEANLSVSALEAQSKFGDSGGSSILNDAMKRGVGVGAHVGLLFTPNASSSPEFSIVARNIGMNYGVGGKATSDRPTTELQTVDLGMSLQPGTKNSRARISMDIYDILNASKQNFYKRLHLGTEVTFSNVLGVLGGLNQGYSTYGVFLNARLLRLDAGIFAEEMGKYPGDNKSRSYYGRLSVGWTK
ncbi:MAG: hypothetical protein RI953_1413 [Pseudomonadota bacterium]|jgi:hypothetical protein